MLLVRTPLWISCVVLAYLYPLLLHSCCCIEFFGHWIMRAVGKGRRRTLMVDDSAEGQHPRPEMGTIVVKIYRVKVNGPWQGKWQPSKHEDTKPVLVSEKAKTLEADTRVGYPPSTL